MRIDAISSDTSRALTALAVRAAAPVQRTERPATGAAPVTFGDGDYRADMGTKGGLVDILA